MVVAVDHGRERFGCDDDHFFAGGVTDEVEGGLEGVKITGTGSINVVSLHEDFAFVGAKFIKNTASEGGCHRGWCTGRADESADFGDIELFLFK